MEVLRTSYLAKSTTGQALGNQSFTGEAKLQEGASWVHFSAAFEEGLDISGVRQPAAAPACRLPAAGAGCR